MNDAIYTHPLNYHNAWQRADITHPRPLIFDLEPTDTGVLEESRGIAEFILLCERCNGSRLCAFILQLPPATITKL